MFTIYCIIILCEIFIYYILENYKINFESQIRLIYGNDIILLILCESLKKV